MQKKHIPDIIGITGYIVTVLSVFVLLLYNWSVDFFVREGAHIVVTILALAFWLGVRDFVRSKYFNEK